MARAAARYSHRAEGQHRHCRNTSPFDVFGLTGINDTGTSALQNLTYAYYPTNNVHTITDAVNSANSQSFSYDNLQRLNQAIGGYGSYGFTYDSDGNRLTQSLGGVTTTYGYGTANDLLTSESVGGVQTQTLQVLQPEGSKRVCDSLSQSTRKGKPC